MTDAELTAIEGLVKQLDAMEDDQTRQRALAYLQNRYQPRYMGPMSVPAPAPPAPEEAAESE